MTPKEQLDIYREAYKKAGENKPKEAVKKAADGPALNAPSTDRRELMFNLTSYPLSINMKPRVHENNGRGAYINTSDNPPIAPTTPSVKSRAAKIDQLKNRWKWRDMFKTNPELETNMLRMEAQRANAQARQNLAAEQQRVKEIKDRYQFQPRSAETNIGNRQDIRALEEDTRRLKEQQAKTKFYQN